MNLKDESLSPSYLPVPWEYREVIEEQIAKRSTGKIIFFCKEEGICERTGAILELKEIDGEGLFVFTDRSERIRVDRIITLFGKPGAAYDEYNAYADACMDCTGGYEKEELKGYSI